MAGDSLGRVGEDLGKAHGALVQGYARHLKKTSQLTDPFGMITLFIFDMRVRLPGKAVRFVVVDRDPRYEKP